VESVVILDGNSTYCKLSTPNSQPIEIITFHPYANENGALNMTVTLGIEGTAWAASAAIFDSNSNTVHIETIPYLPDSGGLHPKEAAEHMRKALPQVIETIFTKLEAPPDAVAFSRGPGLGPCLRICATAARALSGTFNVPLIGVNHMLAHLEVGRHFSEFSTPVCLNASGANAHLLGYYNGYYRVLGETMDTGVGNALDKFARHVGWAHPGGPKIEKTALDGNFFDLPYIVKGMDFSFSGLTTAAITAYDQGHPIEDVCFSLQETIFSILAEVSERALSLLHCDEFILGGGVGNNARLQDILESMCTDRGAEYFAPDPRFLSDNAGMIAILGSYMFDVGDTISIEDSHVLSNFRPDMVKITWPVPSRNLSPVPQTTIQGSEALVEFDTDTVWKKRLPKPYRNPTMDLRLRRHRMNVEARLTHEARKIGIPTPIIKGIDPLHFTLEFQKVGDADLSDGLNQQRVENVINYLSLLHSSGIAHGDPTTRNIRIDSSSNQVYLIDFGLGFHTDNIEDYAMDLHIFKGSLIGTSSDYKELWDHAESIYGAQGDSSVLTRLQEIELRGRYL
jgi:N6-L-threonylcarbamoyladenine synthase/protein kinase Bud32